MKEITERFGNKFHLSSLQRHKVNCLRLVDADLPHPMDPPSVPMPKIDRSMPGTDVLIDPRIRPADMTTDWIIGKHGALLDRIERLSERIEAGDSDSMALAALQAISKQLKALQDSMTVGRPVNQTNIQVINEAARPATPSIELDDLLSRLQGAPQEVRLWLAPQLLELQVEPESLPAGIVN